MTIKFDEIISKVSGIEPGDKIIITAENGKIIIVKQEEPKNG